VTRYTRTIGGNPCLAYKCGGVYEEIAAVVATFGPPEARNGDFVWSFRDSSNRQFSIWTQVGSRSGDVELAVFVDMPIVEIEADSILDWFCVAISDVRVGNAEPSFILSSPEPEYVISEIRRAA